MILGTSDIGFKISFTAAVQLVERFRELGGREFDTAHTYAHWVPGMLGSSETTLRQVLRTIGVPESDVQITTKGGHPESPGYPRPSRYLAPELVWQDLSESLERLQVDQVHTYLLHRDDSSVPVDEVADLLRSIQESGKARHVGVSNWPLQRVQELRQRLTGTLVWQNQGSLALPNWQETDDPTVRRFRHDDFIWAEKNQVVCCAYSATANGFFANGATGESYDNVTSRERRDRAQVLALEKGVTANQIALAWLQAQPGDVRPLIGTTRLETLEDAMAARSLKLTAVERDSLGVAE